MLRLPVFALCLLLLVGCDSGDPADAALLSVAVETPSGIPVEGLELSMEYALGNGDGERLVHSAVLRYFDVYALGDGRFRAEWETREEADVARFVVEGGADEDDLNALSDIGDVVPHGANVPYAVEVEGDFRLFRLRIEGTDGGSTYSIPVEPTVVAEEDDPAYPTDLALHIGYPNPFHRATTLQYALPTATSVALEVFDLEGRPVPVQSEGAPVGYLVQGERAAGTHAKQWEADQDLVGGFYRVRLTAGEDTASVLAVYTAGATGPQGQWLHVRTALGQTDAAGRFATDDPALFPQFYDDLEAEFRDENNVLFGVLQPSNEITLILRDAAGREQRYERVLTGSTNSFEFTWDPE